MFIELYPGNKTAFSLNLVNRGFPLSKHLAGDINKHFGNVMLTSQFHKIPIGFSVDNIDKATVFCCDCMTYRINCPICTTSELFSCEYPFGFYSKIHLTWYKVFEHYYKRYSVQPVSVPLKYGLMIIPSYVTGFSFFNKMLPPKTLCSSPTLVRSNYSSDDGTSNCTIVLPSNVPCPNANYKAERKCDWSSKIESKVGHLKVCFSRRRENLVFRFVDNKMHYVCNKKYYFPFPAVTEIIRGMISYEYSDLPFTILGYNEDNVYFSSYNNSLLNKVVGDLSTLSKLSPAPPVDDLFVNLKVICDHNHLLRRHANIYNGDDSWFGDVYIPGKSPIVIYNYTHAVKYNFLYSPYLECNPFVKYTRSSIVSSIRASVNIFGTVTNSSTCKSLSETADCALSDLFNSTFTNMTKLLGSQNRVNVRKLSEAIGNINLKSTVDFTDFQKFIHSENIGFTEKLSNLLNKTFDNFLYNFFDGLSKNGTYEYQCDSGFCYSRIGGWFSDIFAALIEPFFNVFLSLVIRPIFKILIESLIDIIKILSNLLTTLGSELAEVLDELTAALTLLFTTFLNLLIKIYKFLEARILLSEYIILFLFLIYFIKNNSIFSILIVIIFLVIFGFERKTQPSILLTLID